ncbi:MAG: hypothetical protein AB8G22_25070 [Saprospiraceae bacterium]
MKKLTFLIITLLSIGQLSFAQSYDTSAGIRFGSQWGLTVNQRVAKKVTIEGILQAGGKTDLTNLTVLAKKHMPVLTKRFNIYYGAGLQGGWYDNIDIEAGNPFGVAFIGGAEFTFARLNVSWDIKPALNLTGGTRNFYTQTGISVRYVINKKEIFNRNNNKKKKGKKNKDGFNWKVWEKN